MSTRPKSSGNYQIKRVTTSVVSKNSPQGAPHPSDQVLDPFFAGQPSVTPQQPAGAASQATPSLPGNEKVASSVEQTCLKAVTPVTNRMKNLEDSIPCMSLANDQMLVRLGAMETPLQSKA